MDLDKIRERKAELEQEIGTDIALRIRAFREITQQDVRGIAVSFIEHRERGARPIPILHTVSVDLGEI